jgi:peptidoglycan/xylan/chitin deacetylase (PgdA/CDA1 family)
MLQHEVSGSKARLEDLIGTPVRDFCYPYGAVNRQVRYVVEEAGYRSGCSTISGLNDVSVDPFLLQRAEIGAGLNERGFVQRLRHGDALAQAFKNCIKRTGRGIKARLLGLDTLDSAVENVSLLGQ